MHKRFLPVLISFYLISIIGANLLIKSFGAYALLFNSFFLIPFDFVVRCILHEKYANSNLVVKLFLLTFIACIITYALNKDAEYIAIASILAFTSAQIGAGIFYQLSKKKSYFFKVNISDLFAICFDSIVFQLYAFDRIQVSIVFWQIVVKFLGGLMWYFILFKYFKIQNKFL